MSIGSPAIGPIAAFFRPLRPLTDAFRLAIDVPFVIGTSLTFVPHYGQRWITMFRKILVPLDGSHLSERALLPARQLAAEARAQLILLSVPYLKHMFVQEHGTYGFLLPHESLGLTRRELHHYLSALQSGYESAELAIETRVLDGEEASVILKTAVTEAVDLIVMSSHGRSGLSRLVLGSVTEEVVQRAPCPVWVIRQAQRPSQVVITLDGTRLSEAALKPGIRIARHFGSEVTLLRAFGSESIDVEKLASGLEEERETGQRIYLERRCEAENHLKQMARIYQPALGRRIQVALCAGLPDEAIPAYVRSRGVDCLVMARRARTGIRHWLGGSLAGRVLRCTGCSMLILAGK
jgi:nucleotide-binding universal stress UspA family protein